MALMGTYLRSISNKFFLHHHSNKRQRFFVLSCVARGVVYVLWLAGAVISPPDLSSPTHSRSPITTTHLCNPRRSPPYNPHNNVGTVRELRDIGHAAPPFLRYPRVPCMERGYTCVEPDPPCESPPRGESWGYSEDREGTGTNLSRSCSRSGLRYAGSSDSGSRRRGAVAVSAMKRLPGGKATAACFPLDTSHPAPAPAPKRQHARNRYERPWPVTPRNAAHARLSMESVSLTLAVRTRRHRGGAHVWCDAGWAKHRRIIRKGGACAGLDRLRIARLSVHVGCRRAAGAGFAP